MTEAKPQPDWKAIELDYRAGIKTLREIADAHGITHGAINKRAKRDGWTRDLQAKIHAKADELVSKQVVSKTVSKEQRILERDFVEACADEIAAVRLTHKRGIARAWRIVDMLMQELEHQTDNIDLYEQLGELMYSPDDKGVDKLNEVYRKAMSLPSRSSTVKTLLEALKTAIGLEREALGITDRTPGSDDDPLSRIIKAVQGTGLKPVSVIEGESEVVPNE